MRHRPTRRLARLALALAAIAPVTGTAQRLYKNVMPDGRIIYTDAPMPGAVQSKVLELPPPPSESQRAAAERRAEEEKKKRDDLQGRISERRKAFDQAEDRVARARKGVEQAQTALEQGRALQAGDVVGTAGGGTRPNEEYFRRISDLERGLESARKELDDALRARSNLR